nr:hypothetical protein [Nonlabens ulvanivorans]
MKKIFIIFVLAISLASCSDNEYATYDANSPNPLVAFGNTNYTLGIEIDADGGELNIPINSSSISNTDRLFNVTIIPTANMAISGTYTVPATVTIPANEYIGTLTVTGSDVQNMGNDVTTSPLTLELQIEQGSGYTVGPNTIVSVLQVCPVDETFFTGDYQMTHLVFNGFGVPTFGFGTVVTLSNPGGTSRTFPAPYAPDLGSFGAVTWEFGLSCNEIVWTATQDSGIGCAATPANIELSTADAAFGNGHMIH